MDTGLDWSQEDSFSADESEALLDWYRTVHGLGDLKLVPFAPFLLQFMPAALKRTRRHVQATMLPNDGVALPSVTNLLFNVHAFSALAFKGESCTS